MSSKMNVVDVENKIKNKTLKISKEDHLKDLSSTNIDMLTCLGEIDVLDLSECEELKEIPNNYFYDNKLKKVFLPNTIEKIGINAFRQSHNLELLDLTNCYNLKDLSEYSFAESNIKTVVLGESLEHIGECAFANCNINLFDASKAFALKGLNEYPISNSKIKNLYIRGYQLENNTLAYSYVKHLISDIDGYKFFDLKKDKLLETNIDKVYYIEQEDEFNYYKLDEAIKNGALELVVDNTHNKKFRR